MATTIEAICARITSLVDAEPPISNSECRSERFVSASLSVVPGTLVLARAYLSRRIYQYDSRGRCGACAEDV